MTPAARYAAAIEVLDQWIVGRPLEQALTHWARGSRYAGSKDRAAVRDHVFDAVRCLGRCRALGGSGTGRGVILGLLKLQGIAPENVFNGEGHAPAALTTSERDMSVDPPDAMADIPNWLRPKLAARAPSDVQALAASFAERAPLWLRVNLRRATCAEAAESLIAEGVATRPHPTLVTALEVTENPRRMRQTAAYANGLVEPQDLSVQAAMARVDWPKQGRILDYCAGGGGKALALADHSEAVIFAHDINVKRMADLAPRAARAGVAITTIAPDDVMQEVPYDAVLVDAPCSGSGTWRRDPEAKWRLTADRLDELVALQADILAKAAELVAADGMLIYMTCSLFHVENEDQVDAFLAAHPEWRRMAQHCDTMLTASDGFFSATLSRV
ncbi:RsmB/NOP family class I SAM-dependent RNA methyltransferase [Gymnodinialimonas sp. 2305UL16-5]|uniref:RsmB/NOP family class I SAM-dependent RNA methyltransferase n=1 Tax=Gymnodinialimonas mytili TaxID=3126503 RepID=UPI003099BA4D